MNEPLLSEWPGYRFPPLTHLNAMPPFVLLESYDSTHYTRSYLFEDPVDTIVAARREDVLPTMQRLEEETNRGQHCAGFIAYEAASAFDPALRTHPPLPDLPLVWFGVFRNRSEVKAGSRVNDTSYSLSPWESSIGRSEYDRALEQIYDYIAAGDTYQVNFTFRQFSRFSGCAFALYRTLCRAQGASCCAFLDTGRFQILSASPELFFRVAGEVIETRPMKGTLARGRWFKEDEEAVRALATCQKNQAENLMIVDLMRNDLGRIAQIGTVAVRELFAVERYATVLQMTSTVTARLKPNLSLIQLFRALFPSGSVTGAPKIHTMELIHQLETTPRGVYTGAIGFVSPDREMAFNVAIRTVTIDSLSGRAQCGVGGGITYDSEAQAEFDECEVKTRFLTVPRPEFELLESLLYEPDNGFFLLDRHLDRLTASARYFEFAINASELRHKLLDVAADWPRGRHKVRLLLARNGRHRIEWELIENTAAPGAGLPGPPPPLRVRVSPDPVDSRNPFLFHKTTNRTVYDSRKTGQDDVDDVILLNERGEVTESTRANAVVERAGLRFTPPVESGLLAGTFRAELLARGEIEEHVLTPHDLATADALFLINSVRKWMPARLV